ncbi:MAG: type-4 uracil-DNA glycosylase [Candidatus Methanomethylicia archaeon]
MSSKYVEMEEVIREIVNCRKCELWRARNNPVPGEGSLNAEVMFIGEAPGYNEDIQGRPFVGAAGKLLDTLISEFLNLTRSNVYIANVLKCRPPGNRDPLPEEVELCTPYLDRQLLIIRPKVIVTLGRHSTIYLMQKAGIKVGEISSVRGRLYRVNILGLSINLIPTFHPAAALYNPKLRGILEEDFRRIRDALQVRGVKQLGIEEFLS